MKRFHPSVGAILATAVVLAMTPFASAAPGDATKCLAAKIKIVGKYEACRYKAESVAVVKELAPDNTKCEAKFTESWQKTETTYGLDCPTTGDAVSINGDATAHVNEIVTTLKNVAPVCGNGVINAGEICDGAALGGETCVTQGYGSGTLACLPTCDGFDQSACVLQECDLLNQASCTTPGQACYPLGSNRVCAGAGSSTEGDACIYANSCVPGQACVGGFCALMCDSIDNDPGCAVNQACVNDPQWGANAGYCVNP